MSDPYHILIRQTGGPDVLEAEAMPLPAPEAGEILVRHEAVGLNFIDVYHRTGLYPLPLPAVPGSEAAGTVEAVGEGVEGLRQGDRIGYFAGPLGAYASHRTIAADRVVKLPDSIEPELAAAAMLKGCTAEFLIERCAKIEAGETVLVHAAAGGVGSILVPWLKAISATVIAHAGSRPKADRAAAAGADHSLCCPYDQLAAEVRGLTGGRGVDVVLDGVGAASWEASIGSIAKRGLIVSFGNASGAVRPIHVRELVAAGSVFLTRPTLFDYVATRDELEHSAQRLFEMIGNGTIKVEIGARFPLREAADAHRTLEARSTTGSTILMP
jgi:NADPH2:quinone reductase